ncbi:short chain dehydrogenase [Xylariaceae sp. FL0255]|nr:short chain dehydrogenase [Xylariaceae sp. FL0255]
MDTTNLFRLDGMVAVVTGGGSGIGFVMAKGLAGAGAKKVYILGRRKDVLEDASKAHASLTPLVCDVTSKESLQVAVDTITKEVGYVNLLIANSGILGPPVTWGSGLSVSELRKRLFTDVSMDDFTDTFRVNVTGAYFTFLAFLELLDAGNKKALSSKDAWGAAIPGGSPDVPSVPSQVIFTSSISGYSRNTVSAPAYAGSKAAITHLTKHSATNSAALGIRVNALAPGLFPSEIAMNLMRDRDPSKEDRSNPKFIPSRRFGTDEEMAGTVVYLASRAGAYCNGSILVPDGGRLSVMESAY